VDLARGLSRIVCDLVSCQIRQSGPKHGVKKTRSASRRASMAPDATVLVAPRRQNSFSHRSFDGDGVLGRCTDAADTSAALRLEFWLDLAGPAEQLSSPLSARDVARWCSFDLTVRNRYQFILQCKEGVREDVSSSQNAISKAVTCTHPAARPPPSHAAGLHTGRSARRARNARWLNRAGSSTILSCLGRLASSMRWGCWAGLRFRSPHARAHAPGGTPTVPRAQLRVARVPAAAAAAAAAVAGMLLLLLLLLLLLHTSPLPSSSVAPGRSALAALFGPSSNPRSSSVAHRQLVKPGAGTHCSGSSSARSRAVALHRLRWERLMGSTCRCVCVCDAL
jgi:hypothetical protein